jgi:hypothetical protein
LSAPFDLFRKLSSSSSFLPVDRVLQETRFWAFKPKRKILRVFRFYPNHWKIWENFELRGISPVF